MYARHFNPGTVNEKKALTGLNLVLEHGDFATIVGSNLGQENLRCSMR